MRGPWAHGAGFLVSGLLAFATDAGVLWMVTHSGAMNPYTGRLVAIAVAMVVAYFAHRTLTFGVSEPPGLRQFAKFCSLAATANAINYAIYAGILIAHPDSPPLYALLVATLVATVVSYLGMRFGVFRRPTP
ncbi:MAG: GtrA family protein [Hyphomicrobium sp.]